MFITRVRRLCRRLRHAYPISLAIGCVLLWLLLIRNKNNKLQDDYEGLYPTTYNTNKSHRVHRTASKQVCVLPELDPRSFMKFFYNVPPVVCNNEPDWILIENGVVTINPLLVVKYGDFKCEIRYIIRVDDYNTTLSVPVILNNVSKINLEHDFFTCRCVSKLNILKRIYKTYIYENVHAGISTRQEVKLRQPNIGSGLGLNVLMIGYDSVSQIAYKFKLKNTYKYFMETLNGIVLNGYNIVGDGTPQALIPILTGKTELELPSTLKNHVPKTHVDVYPLIWKDFKEKGYVTAFGEDISSIGCFTYRMNGFKEQPTDHYLLPFYLESEKYHWKFPKLCLGSRKRSEIFLDWYKQFFIKYRNKPKFAFGFNNEMSHDNLNLLETTDGDLLSTLKFLNEEGYLNNTLLILMSDHGPRFSKFRTSLQGKQGERRPFFGFAFPKWFEEKYPKIIKNIKINSNRLATPFDIYYTLKDILNYDESTGNNIKDRGMSLFKEIPEERSCEHAHVDPHWCACLDWVSIETSNKNVLKAGDSIVKYINSLTEPYRSLCAMLNIHEIIEASVVLPKKSMLKFKGSKDKDGRIPDLSDKTHIGDVNYQLWIQTTPGNALFEVTLIHKRENNEFFIQTGDISRINKYGSAPWCIQKLNPELRKFCYCK